MVEAEFDLRNYGLDQPLDFAAKVALMRVHYRCDPWQWIKPVYDADGNETDELETTEFALYWGALDFHLKLERKINTQLEQQIRR